MKMTKNNGPKGMAFQLENTRPTWPNVWEVGARPQILAAIKPQSLTAWTASTQQIKSTQVLYLFMWDFSISHLLLSVWLSSLFLNFDVILVLTDTQVPKSVFFHSSPCLFSFFTSILRLPPCPALILIGHKNSLILLPRMFFLHIPERLSPTIMLLTTLQTPLSLYPRLLCPLLFTFWHHAFQHTTNILFVTDIFIDSWGLLDIGTVVQSVCCSRALGAGSWRNTALSIQPGVLVNDLSDWRRRPAPNWCVQLACWERTPFFNMYKWQPWSPFSKNRSVRRETQCLEQCLTCTRWRVSKHCWSDIWKLIHVFST